MTIVADSSFFVSLFLDTDEHHKEAVKIFDKLFTSHTVLLAPTLFFPEVAGTIRRKTSNMHFAEIIEETLERWLENFIVVKELTKKRMRSSVEHAILYGLKGADAIFASLATETDSELLTFDSKMKDRIKGKVKLFNV